jgi:hypothetical protein
LNTSELEKAIRDAKTEEELSTLEQLMLSRFHVGSLGEVARLVGVELQTVKEWRSGPNPMPGSEGQWDIVQIFRWRCDRLKAASGGGKTQEIMELERRDLQAIVEKRELNARNARGEMMPKDLMHSGLMSAFLVLKQGMEVVQRQFGPEAHKILEQAIGECIRKIDDLFGPDPEADDAGD